MSRLHDRWARLADRRAADEDLEPGDLQWCEEFERSDAAASAEQEVWDRMGGILDAKPALSQASAKRLVDAALELDARGPQLDVASQRRRVLRRGVLVIGVGSAAAATLLLWQPDRQPASSHAPDGMEMIVKSGEIVADGMASGLDSEVVVAGEAAFVVSGCLEAPTIRLCGDTGAAFEVRKSPDGRTAPEIHIRRGRVAAAVSKDHDGRLSGGAASVDARAVVLVFEVAGTVATPSNVVTVLSGRASVNFGDGPFDVHAHERVESSGAGPVTRSQADRATETALWDLLEQPLPPAEAGVEPPSSAAPPPTPPSTRRSARGPSESPGAVPTAAELAAFARDQLGRREWKSAAGAYARLIDAYPNSSQAQVALVRLADLELRHLSAPHDALKTYDRYLERGGSLKREAELGRIRALRALKRRSDEADAIERFLTAYPDAVESRELRGRRDQLRPRPTPGDAPAPR